MLHRTWPGLLVAIACTDGSISVPKTDAPPFAEDRIVQVAAPLVDVLFVIDDSISMADELDALATELPQFVQTLSTWAVDFHIGVTTTDADDAATAGRLESVDGVRFVTATSPQSVRTLGDLVRVGAEGSSEEQGLLAAFLALDTYSGTPENQGFLRDGSSIATIIVSDEDDDSTFPLLDFTRWYEGIGSDRSLSAIVAQRDTADIERGERYLLASRRIGGVTWDIETEDWDQLLEQLGLRSVGLRRDFALSESPVVPTISVTLERNVGGKVQVSDPGPWAYEPARNAIVLTERTPEADDVLVIRYEVVLEPTADP